MRIEVWSDIACPWCWLGKHHLEAALRNAGEEAQVELRSFELNPQAGATIPAKAYLEARLGGAHRVGLAHSRLSAMGLATGIHFDFERARVANTFDAHRVHHHAKAEGLGAQVVERFMKGYHGEGEDLADHGVIKRLAVDAGLRAASVDAVLSSDAHASDVREDEARAIGLGIHGVPFFLFDGKWGVSGAQPVAVFVEAIRIARGGASPGE